MGAGALGYSLWAAYEGIAATRWPRVQGRITTAKVEEVIGGHGPDWEPKVTYSYQVAGTTHTGSRIAFSDNSTPSQSSAEKKLGRYPVGTPVTVRYDRSDPQRSVLEPGMRLVNVLFAGVSALLLLAGLSNLGLFYSNRGLP